MAPSPQAAARRSKARLLPRNPSGLSGLSMLLTFASCCFDKMKRLAAVLLSYVPCRAFHALTSHYAGSLPVSADARPSSFLVAGLQTTARTPIASPRWCRCWATTGWPSTWSATWNRARRSSTTTTIARPKRQTGRLLKRTGRNGSAKCRKHEGPPKRGRGSDRVPIISDCLITFVHFQAEEQPIVQVLTGVRIHSTVMKYVSDNTRSSCLLIVVFILTWHHAL
jgi:hypothetical protein